VAALRAAITTFARSATRALARDDDHRVQPTFETQRLQLRPATLADLDALWALWTAPAVRRFLWDDRAITRDEAAAALGLWVIEARGEVGATGCAGLLPVSTAAEHDPRLAGLVEPLVALAPAAWGRGYAGEALAALLGHAAGALGLARLAGVTDGPNVASDRMLRRAGFRVLGEVPGPRHGLRTYLWEPHATAEGAAG
jgi:RimJ/RimL family protein N-acetyltransferase